MFMTEPIGKKIINNMDIANKYLYKNGLPFNDELANNLTKQKEQRIDKKFPSVILVDGGQGQGKTTLIVEAIDFINKLCGLPECDLHKSHHPQLALGGKEFIKNFNDCKKEGLPIIGYDESGDYSKRSSMTKFNAMLNRRFETMRSSNIIVLFALPNFNVLDNHLFDLQVVRGALHLYERQENYGQYFGYSLTQTNWLRYWWDELPKPRKHEAYKKTIPNFRGEFKDLEPERAKLLKALSDYGKDMQSQESEIKSYGLITFQDIATTLNRSLVWVRLIIRKLRIKPVRLLSNVKYFDKSTIDILSDHIEGIRK